MAFAADSCTKMHTECMITFQDLSISDSEKIKPFVNQYSPKWLGGYTLANLLAWNDTLQYRYAIIHNKCLLISTRIEDGNCYLLQPLGIIDQEVQTSILSWIKSRDYNVKILASSKDFIDKESNFCSQFSICENPSLSNYIYLASDLAALPGRKYQKKRNLIHQFQNSHTFKSEAVSIKNLNTIKQLYDLIVENEHKSTMLHSESLALAYLLTHFSDLKHEGIILYIDEQAVAFGLYERQDSETAVIHFEKALKDYKGLYQVINQELAKKIESQGYTYINREEDLGIEGLRQAKQSYFPIQLQAAYTLVYHSK